MAAVPDSCFTVTGPFGGSEGLTFQSNKEQLISMLKSTMKVFSIITCSSETPLNGVTYTKVGGIFLRLIDSAVDNKITNLNPLGTDQNLKCSGNPLDQASSERIIYVQQHYSSNVTSALTFVTSNNKKFVIGVQRTHSSFSTKTTEFSEKSPLVGFVAYQNQDKTFASIGWISADMDCVYRSEQGETEPTAVSQEEQAVTEAGEGDSARLSTVKGNGDVT